MRRSKVNQKLELLTANLDLAQDQLERMQSRGVMQNKPNFSACSVISLFFWLTIWLFLLASIGLFTVLGVTVFLTYILPVLIVIMSFAVIGAMVVVAIKLLIWLIWG